MNHLDQTRLFRPDSTPHGDGKPLHVPWKSPFPATPSDSSPARYSIVRTAPPIDPADVERDDVSVVEMHVLWGGELMNVAHLRGPESYGLGRLPGEIELGASCLQFSGGRAAVVLGSEGRARVASGKGNAPAEVATSGWVGLDTVEHVELEVGPLTYRVALTKAGKPSPRAIAGRSDRHVPLFFAAAALLHGAMIAALALHAPALGVASDDLLDRDRLYVLQQYLKASAEREREPEPSVAEDTASDGGPSEVAASGPEGKLGTPEPSTTKGRLAIAADLESPSRSLTRETVLDAARNFGMIGLLSSFDASVPSSPFAEFAEGNDAMNALGDLWSDSIGERTGSGLALNGVGMGGGYVGDKIGLGRIGTCGGSPCSGDGGFGRFGARTGGSHLAKAPEIRSTGPVTSGRLPATIIQRVVRQNFGRFRFCYESGLRENPNLAGRVTARFVIARDGSVATVQSGGSDMPNAGVVKCVLDAYRGLSFPPPEEGVVTVSYPISFTPAG